MNTSGLLQETRSIHDSMNLPKIEFISSVDTLNICMKEFGRTEKLIFDKMTAVIITKGSMFLFLQEVRDARKIRNRILSNFELATEPGLSKAECRRLLHIVIVGGGPTGVEFGAEIYDFVEQVILMVLLLYFLVDYFF